METALEALTLESHHKNTLTVRYIPLLRSYRRRALLFAYLFHVMRAIVTVGSITVPALLSVAPADTWLTWAISLAVSICNGVLTLFKIDKKYYSLHTTMHVLDSEGWQYIGLAGKYSRARQGESIGFANSHKYQFIHFCFAVEKIKMLQVQEEYWKAQEEKEKPGIQGSSTATGQGIVPQSASPQQKPTTEELLTWIQGIVEDSRQSATGNAQNTITQPPSEQSSNV